MTEDTPLASKKSPAMQQEVSPGALRMRRIRADRRAAGQCPEDGDPAVAGSKHCQFHKDQERRRMKRKRLDTHKAHLRQ